MPGPPGLKINLIFYAYCLYIQRLPPLPGPDERAGCLTSLMIGGGCDVVPFSVPKLPRCAAGALYRYVATRTMEDPTQNGKVIG